MLYSQAPRLDHLADFTFYYRERSKVILDKQLQAGHRFERAIFMY